MRRTYVITGLIVAAVVGVSYLSLAGFGGGVFRQLGSVVGMYASIEPNDYNLLAQQLNKRSQELDAREAALEEKELSTSSNTNTQSDRKAIVYITSIGTLLLALVLLNFYLDIKRRN